MSNTSVLTTQPAQSQRPLSIELTQAHKMSAYYRFHAQIYDLTRWTFLFGRHWLIDWLPFKYLERFNLLEVGCGTGHNLKYLAECFPKARLTGMDASGEMLQIAQHKFTDTYNKPLLLNQLYGEGSPDFGFQHSTQPSNHHSNTRNSKYVIARDLATEASRRPQVILFSYCLTMVNPDWDKLILQAKEDLGANGMIAVVDFHSSPSHLFKKWMGKKHVRMDAHILPFLQENFDTVKYEIRRAYMGLWHYSLYIGKKKA
jgi:S-adenosylmethionine-diacylgycerolhomoserine-N-methlytransferase